jgi:proton translocating ATP synthase F1 alpha subunit
MKRGIRIALRTKVNEFLFTGISICDALLPVGRGQRQLVLGDRYTGKSSMIMSAIIANMTMNVMGSMDGYGSKRIFIVMSIIATNYSKVAAMIAVTYVAEAFLLWIVTTASVSPILIYICPILSIAMGERCLRDRGYDVICVYDDISKHAKAYRQLSLLQNKLAGRDSYAQDVFQLHAALLERSSNNSVSNGGSISCFPIIEVINNDITEYIATNVISITDGQYYTNRTLFNDSLRPAIDSGLSVSRVGSNAQCKLMKLISTGIKNELTNYRLASSLDLISMRVLGSMNNLFFQDYLFIRTIETTLILLLIYKNNILYNNSIQIHRLVFILSFDYIYFYYIIFIMKIKYNVVMYYFLLYFLGIMVCY